MTLISITGNCSSGKTVIAECLKKNLPGVALVLSESTSIKGLKQLVKFDKNIKWLITDGFVFGNDAITQLMEVLPHSELKTANVHCDV